MLVVFNRTFFFSQRRHSLQHNAAKVELPEEGPRLFTNLVEVGMPVEIVFNAETGVKFRPVGKP